MLHQSQFHGNISVKAGIPRKQFDLCTGILVATIAACYANTIVEPSLYNYCLTHKFNTESNYGNVHAHGSKGHGLKAAQNNSATLPVYSYHTEYSTLEARWAVMRWQGIHFEYSGAPSAWHKATVATYNNRTTRGSVPNASGGPPQYTVKANNNSLGNRCR